MVGSLTRFPIVVACLGLTLAAGAAIPEAWTVRLPATGRLVGLVVGPGGSVYWAGSQGAAELLHRRAQTGQLVWSRELGDQFDGRVGALAALPDSSGVVLAGSINGANSRIRPWVARHQADTGERLWSRVVRARWPLSIAFVRAVAVSPDSSAIYVAGVIGEDESPLFDRNFVTKLRADGKVLWTVMDDRLGGAPAAIAVDPQGNGAYVVGQVHGPQYGQTRSLVARYSTDGEFLWSSPYDGVATDHVSLNAAVVSADGQTLWAAGGYADFSDLTNQSDDWVLAEYRTADGTSLRMRRIKIAGSGPESARALISTVDGKEFWATGQDCANRSCSAHLVRLARSGRILDRVTFAEPSYLASSHSLGLDPRGNPIWAGLAIDEPWIQKVRPAK